MRYKYARNIMNRGPRIVLYVCLNVCKTVSTDAMQVLMGLLPWDLKCMRTGLIRMIVNGWSICENELVNVDELNGRSVEECVNLVNERAYVRWQTRCNESVNGRVTYEFIKNVRFGERNAWFDSIVYACFLLTEHESMNAFLYERNLCNSEKCVRGAERGLATCVG